MRKLLSISALSILLLSCGGKETNQSIENLIESKNIKELQAKKSALQADIAKIEEALATLDVKKEEALVSVLQVKILFLITI